MSRWRLSALVVWGGLSVGLGPEPAWAQDPAAADTSRSTATETSPAETGASPDTAASAALDSSPFYNTWTPWIRDFAVPAYFLDDRLVAPLLGGSLRPPLDPRVVLIRVDSQSDLITTSVAAADVTLTPERVESLDAYAARMTSTQLRSGWVKASRERINRTPLDASTTGSGLQISVPVQLPTAVKSLLGVGTPSINVSGSERISISGRSNWTNQENVYGRKPSLFPQLDMQQDLQINVSGTLGDKMLIDIDQSSGAQTSLANRVALRYNGYDDDVIRKIHLGNTQLSLPGTQYVSYSGRNDGLFGIMSEARFGESDLALIASKQEARSERSSYVGTALTRTVALEDWNFIERKYFLLQLPESRLDANGELIDGIANVDLTGVEVFVSDNVDDNLEGEQPGFAEMRDPRSGSAPDTTRLFGKFDRKLPIQDFTVRQDLYGPEFPVLELTTPVNRNATLAVAYREQGGGQVGLTEGDTLRLKLLKAPIETHRVDAAGLFTEDLAVDPFAPVREYELRNFYNLATSGLDPQTTRIQVKRFAGGGQLDQIEQFLDQQTGQNLSYLEVTGLDLLDQTQGGQAVAGQDGSVDQFRDAVGSATWIDWERGILFFPDLRPFAPRLERPADQYFARSKVGLTPAPSRRRALSLDPAAQEELRGNRGAYDLKNDTQRRESRTFLVFAEFSTSSGSQVLLRNTPVLEGSEIVTINGEVLERDKDYRIDYVSGVVDLITEKARQTAQLSIDYSYAPLFSQASRTLVGSNLSLVNRENFGLGGALIYESRAQQEKRPRIGEEPSNAMIADLNGRFNMESGLLTSLTNVLPFYKGWEPSRVQFTGEVGHSIPNPNTRNELYLDDFEGVRISSSPSMDARAWVPPAPPEVIQGSAAVSINTLRDPVDLKWFNPINTVRQKDLRPTLTRAEDRDGPITALSWWIPQPWSGSTHGTLWAGLTQGFGEEGIDLSRSQFIDLWINDFRDFNLIRKPGVILHIDVGVVSEDAQRRPDQLPNGVLDTEDQLPRDRLLDKTEDTGLDSLFSLDETVLVDPTASLNASPADPSGDDFDVPDEVYEDERDPRRWRFANGTEDNQNYRGSPDSEDLDADGQIDVLNNFFRFSFDVTDSTFLDTDVYEEFSGDPNLIEPIAEDNGWRRFLIPLDAPSREIFGNPDFFNVKQIRIWIEGLDQLPPLDMNPETPVRPLLEVAQMDIVGNRWVPAAVDSADAAQGQKLVMRTVNNREDATVYEPPFAVDTQSQGGSTASEREQSLGLRATHIVAGSEVSAFRSTTLPENYSLYESLRFYLAALDFAPQDSVRFFLRFLSDAGTVQNNYYEYSAPIPPPAPLGTKPVPWRQYEVPLTDLSTLKLDRSSDTATVRIDRPSPNGGTEELVARGTPSFTRVQRVVVGLRNAGGPGAFPTEVGEIWIDELRAFNVDRSEGNAGRLQVTTNFSDLMDLNVRADYQDQNFVRLGQFQGNGTNVLSTSVLGTVRMEQFVRGSGFQFPISFSFNASRSVPRFFTGQDIELRPEDSERQRSSSWQRSLSGSASHRGSTGFLLRNTLDALSFRYSMTDQNGLSPTRRDTTRVLSGSGVYSLSPGAWFQLPLPLLKDRAGNRRKLQFLPTTASIGFSMTTRRSIVYDRTGTSDQAEFTSRYGRIYSKSALYNLAAAWQPLPFFNYSISAVRNANLPGITPQYVAGINFGRMTNLSQRFDVRVPIRFGPWISPEFDFNSQYAEARTPELSQDLTIGNFSNGGAANVRYTLPLRRLAPAPTDTTGAGPLDWLGGLMGRIGDVQASAGVNRTTSYNYLTGYPNMQYRLGIWRDPGFSPDETGNTSVFRTQSSSENSQRTYRGEASTQLQLFGRATARFRINYNNILRTSNTQAFVQTTFNWPDVTVEWGGVQGLLRLGSVFPTLTATTRYNRSENTDGVYKQELPSSRTTTSNWQPLLSLSGTTKGGVQVQLSGDRSTSLREDFRNAIFTGAPSVNEQANTTVRGNLTKTLNPGSKFLLGLFGSTLRSTVTLNLTSSFNRRTGGTRVPGTDRLGSPIDQSRFEILGTGSYQLSRTVTASLGLGFNQFNDFTRTVTSSQASLEDRQTLVQRSVRLEATVQMRF